MLKEFRRSFFSMPHRLVQDARRKGRKRGRLQSKTVQDFIFGKHSIERGVIRYESNIRLSELRL
jgi:hypothetical protein